MIKLFYKGEPKKDYDQMLHRFEKVDKVEDCGFIVYPYPYGTGDYQKNSKWLKGVQEYSMKVKKPYIVFFIDDVEEPYLSGFGIQFRTSYRRSENPVWVECLPSFRYDIDEQLPPVAGNTIGFCGSLTHPAREEAIRELGRAFPHDFIIRSKWYGEYTQEQKKRYKAEFVKNMNDNPFQLCVRGAGNFSHRFYETFMYGRIPVLWDTDCPLPCPDLIDWRFTIPISGNIDVLMHKMKFHIGHEITDQGYMRSLWEICFTRKGFGNYLHDFLSKHPLYEKATKEA